MQGARRGTWWVLRPNRATPQTPLTRPTLRDRADFASSIVVASLLGLDPTASAPPRLKPNPARSRPRGILRQAPGAQPARISAWRFLPTVKRAVPLASRSCAVMVAVAVRTG